MEYLVLYLLQQPMSFRELEDITGYSRESLNAFIKDLMENGLIQRTGKRRKYIYSLTLKGFLKLWIHRLRKLLEEADKNE